MTRLHLPTRDICEAATEYAMDTSEPFVFNHAMRSFFFADALGKASGANFDRDLLFLACVLHDLGLNTEAPVQTRFEVEGADAAVAFARKHGLNQSDCALLWDAIALHTTPVIPQRKPPVVALCQLGTAVDVGFAPRTMVAEATVAEVLERYPRLAFKSCMPQALCGLVGRDREAAELSYVAADAAERLLPDYRRPHICDVISMAGFDE